VATDNLASYLSTKATSYIDWDLTASGATNRGLGHGYGLWGVFWTAVRDVPQMSPAAPPIFQDYSNRYYGTFLGITFDKTLGLAHAVCRWCDIGECPQCARSVCRNCRITRDGKTLVSDPRTKRIWAKSAAGATEITSEFSEEALGAIFQPGMRLLVASERSIWSGPGKAALATLSETGTTVESTLVLGEAGLTKHQAARTASAETTTASSGPAPAPRREFGAVLSAVENAVFVIGGKLASGELAGDLWLYDIDRERWTQVPFVGPAPRKVIAAAFLAETRSLWLVDQSDDNPVLARILRFDLDTQTFHQAGKWPRTLVIDRVELSGGSRGDLVLSGSSTQIGRVAGVILRPNGNELDVVGAFLRKGTLAVEPTLGDAGLTLPLSSSDPSGSDNLFLTNGELMFPPEPSRRERQPEPKPKGPPVFEDPPEETLPPGRQPPRLRIDDVL
jgi:hypothetical protein